MGFTFIGALIGLIAGGLPGLIVGGLIGYGVGVLLRQSIVGGLRSVQSQLVESVFAVMGAPLPKNARARLIQPTT